MDRRAMRRIGDLYDQVSFYAWFHVIKAQRGKRALVMHRRKRHK